MTQYKFRKINPPSTWEYVETITGKFVLQNVDAEGWVFFEEDGTKKIPTKEPISSSVEIMMHR